MAPPRKRRAPPPPASAGPPPRPPPRRPSSRPEPPPAGRAPDPAPEPQILKPSRLWPNTAYGNVIYLVVIVGGGLFGWSIVSSDDSLAGPTWLIPISLAVSGYIIATFWRNLFINAGAFSRAPRTSNGRLQTAPDGAPVRGGISWKAIFWVVVSAAASALAKEFWWDL